MSTVRSRRTHLTPKEQQLYFGALGRGDKAISVAEAGRRLDISKNYAAKLLHGLNDKGVAVRSAKGVYALADPSTLADAGGPSLDPLAALDDLMASMELEYYVAFGSAASFHGFYDQVPYGISVAVRNWRPRRRIGRHRIVFHQVPADHFWGTVRIPYRDEHVTASDPAKTLLDCASRIDLIGGGAGLIELAANAAAEPDAWAVYRDPEVLHGALGYARRFSDAPAIQRLGYALKRVGPAPGWPLDRLCESLRPYRGPSVVPLDPGGPDGGPIDGEWGVRDNVARRRLAVA